MEPITIILIVLGFVLLVGSCFFPKEENNELSYDELLKRFAKRELSEEETARLREVVDRIVSEKREEVILKTDDYLSQVANEKIMSVDEFSKQILERLDKNNSDVMFLYNMVTDAKEELKTEIAKAQKAKEALACALEKTGDDKTVQVTEAKKKEPVSKRTVSPKTEPVLKPVVKKEAVEQNKPDEIAALLAATMLSEPDTAAEGDMPKERILALYKSGKSVRDISRELGMGQGEVKLVIDLYGV